MDKKYKGNRVVMINNLELFLKEANSLLAALTEYNNATDRLCEVDLQNLEQENLSSAIDDIEKIIQERERIRESAEVARVAMTKAIEEQDDEDAELIKCVFNGNQAEYALKGDKSLARDVIFKLLAMQKDIIEKDSRIIADYTVKYEEIKNELKNLQGDKKKLDFLNLTAPGEAESGFEV